MGFFRFLLMSSLLVSLISSSQASTIVLSNGNGSSIEIEDKPLTENEPDGFLSQMADSDFQVFQEKRQTYLHNAYRILSKFVWFFGGARRVSQGVFGVFKSTPIISILNPSQDLLDGRGLERVRKLGDRAVKERMEFINRELWSHALIVSRSNEFGGAFAITPHGGIALGQAGRYYSASLGLAISYNAKASQMRVEVFSDFERLLSGIPGQANLGVMFKPSVFVASRSEIEEYAFSNGRSSYPLGPFGIEDSSSHLALALPLNIGVVPSPFDGFMGIQNSTTRKIWYQKVRCSSLAQ